jgi:hypothetical protein
VVSELALRFASVSPQKTAKAGARKEHYHHPRFLMLAMAAARRLGDELRAEGPAAAASPAGGDDTCDERCAQ